MASWNYGKCDLCNGTGRIQGSQTCPICEGYGLWEFVDEDNAAAVLALTEGTDNPRAKLLYEHRITAFNPDNIHDVLNSLSEGHVIGTDTEQRAFDALHQAGAAKWGWAWVHTNRFAIELCRLSGGDRIKHRYALSRLAWKWLEEEGQKKVDAPC